MDKVEHLNKRKRNNWTEFVKIVNKKWNTLNNWNDKKIVVASKSLTLLIYKEVKNFPFKFIT